MEMLYTTLQKSVKCNHGVIAHKIHKMRMTGKVGRWVDNFLTNSCKLGDFWCFCSESSVPVFFLVLASSIDPTMNHSYYLQLSKFENIT